MNNEDKPAFVTAVGNDPARFLQASFLIRGVVVTIRQPLLTPSTDAVQEAWVKILGEVRRT